MPQMLDPNFSRTVVLLAEYGKHGAFGLVVNRRMAEPAHEVIRADPPMDIRKDVYLHVGGPVEPNRAWVLTRHRELDGDALEITGEVYLSAAPGLIRHTLRSSPDPQVRRAGRLRGMGAGPARRGAGGFVVADGARAARPAVRYAH